MFLVMTEDMLDPVFDIDKSSTYVHLIQIVGNSLEEVGKLAHTCLESIINKV